MEEFKYITIPAGTILFRTGELRSNLCSDTSKKGTYFCDMPCMPLGILTENAMSEDAKIYAVRTKIPIRLIVGKYSYRRFSENYCCHFDNDSCSKKHPGLGIAYDLMLSKTEIDPKYKESHFDPGLFALFFDKEKKMIIHGEDFTGNEIFLTDLDEVEVDKVFKVPVEARKILQEQGSRGCYLAWNLILEAN